MTLVSDFLCLSAGKPAVAIGRMGELMKWVGFFFWRAYDFVRLLLLYDPCGENMNKVFGPFDETACRRPP